MPCLRNANLFELLYKLIDGLRLRT